MSLISVIAMENYITVVTDGRVTFNGIPIQEDFPKFIRINDKLFVGYAGDKEPCEAFIKESGLLNVTDWEYEDLSRHLNEKIECFRYKDKKILLAVGGINRKNEIEFFTFKASCVEHRTEQYLPTNLNTEFALLHNGINNKSNVRLVDKLSEYLHITGVQKAEDAIKGQIMLNNYVAQHDSSVNNNIFYTVVKK